MASRTKSSQRRSRLTRYFRNSFHVQIREATQSSSPPQYSKSPMVECLVPTREHSTRDQCLKRSPIGLSREYGHYTAITVEPIPDNLWAAALAELTPGEQERIKSRISTESDDVNTILKELVQSAQKAKDVSEQKRWTFLLGNRRISIREQADKALAFLNRFKQAGDVAVNADPFHAGLPWALIRILLQTAVSERDQHCALILGLERVLYFMNRCEIFMEYLRTCSPETSHVRSNLQDALSKVHIRTLRFLLNACDILEKSTISRTRHAVWRSDDILSFESDCNALEQRLENAVLDFDRTVTQLGLRSVNTKLQRLHNRLEELQKLNEPTSSHISTIEKLWVIHDRDQTGKVLHWTSVIPHEDHHAIASEGRIKNTAEWLLVRSEYEEWECSETSMILWLHGIRKLPVVAL